MYICPLASRIPSTRPPNQPCTSGAVPVWAWLAVVCQPGQGAQMHPVGVAPVQSPRSPVVGEVPAWNYPRHVSRGTRLPTPSLVISSGLSIPPA